MHMRASAGKDASEVDNDWFLCPMGIQHHQSALLRTAFPIENRLLPQARFCVCFLGGGACVTAPACACGGVTHACGMTALGQPPQHHWHHTKRRTRTPTQQDASGLREALRRPGPYGARLADPHLLLWLSAQLDPTDIAAIAQAVREKGELLEGHKVIIDSLAGL
jgi:hypothetical protein